jgi:hypothetical protein
MSADNNTLNLAGTVFNIEVAEFTKKTRKLDEVTKKNKMVEEKYPVIRPEFKSISVAVSLFGALLTLAEERVAGGGVKLAEHFLNDQLEDACDAAFNKETGCLDAEKWKLTASSAERARSAGQSIDKIYQDMAELGAELVVLQRAGVTPDGWQSVTEKDGSQRFGSMNEYALRLNEVMNTIDNLTTVVETKTAELEKRRRDREAKAAQAKAAAAAAATPESVDA